MQRYERIERKRVAERAGNKKVSNSGRSWHSKGDVIEPVTKSGKDAFLTDTKDKLDTQSFTLNFKQMEKHFHDALKAGKTGMIVVYWKDSLGRTRKASIVEDYVLEPLYEVEQ